MRVTSLPIVGAAVSTLACLCGVVAGDSSVVDLADHPYALYIATPFTVCFGAFLTNQVVITDARCMYPFSNSTDVSPGAAGALKAQYLMGVIPSVNTSTTLHDILLSTEVYSKKSQAASRAQVFYSMVSNYVNNQTFLSVDYAAVHAYYSQSQDDETAQQNFDVGIIHLSVPVPDAKPVSLQLDDLDADMAGLHALTFAPATSSKDAATLQKLYQGMDLTKATLTSISSLKRSECDSDFLGAYSLKNIKSFVGQKIPNNASPVYCSKLYENTTACSLDTSIPIKSDGGSVRSANLNSTLYVVPGSAKLISVGNPRVFEARSANGTPCKSNGFVSFPRTIAYKDWIGWATNGSFASNGSWVNKTSSGNAITDFVNQSGAAKSWSHMSGLLISALAIVVATTVSF